MSTENHRQVFLSVWFFGLLLLAGVTWAGEGSRMVNRNIPLPVADLDAKLTPPSIPGQELTADEQTRADRQAAAMAPMDIYDCQTGDTDEGEPCGTQANDGPSMTPPTWGSIAAGETICGTFYASGGVRDNDYFHFDVTAPSGEEIKFTCSSDAYMGYFIMLMNSGGTSYYLYTIGGGLDEISVGPIYLEPGTYSIRVTMNVACPGDCQDYGCGTNSLDEVNGNYRYRLSMNSYTPVAGDDCSLAQELSNGANSFDMNGYTPDDAGMLAVYGYGAYNGWFVYEAQFGDGILEFQFCPDQALIASGEAGDKFGLAVWTECYSWMLDPSLCGRRAFRLVNGGWTNYSCSVDGSVTVSVPEVYGPTFYLEVFALNAPNAGFITGDVTVYVQHVDPTNDQCSSPGNLGSGEISQYVANLWATSVGPYVPNYGFTHTGTVCDDRGLDDDSWMDNDVWYTWTADQTGWWTADFCDPCAWDAMVEVYEGTACPNLSPRYPIACGDDECEGSGVMPRVEFYADAGQSYLIRLGAWQNKWNSGGEMGEAYVDISYATDPGPHPANDDCAGATVETLLPGVPQVRYGTLDNASNNSCLSVPPTVWEGFTLETCCDVTIDYCPQLDGSGVSILTGVNDQNYHLAPEVLFTDCPCYDGLVIAANSSEWGLCPQEHFLKTMHFDNLPTGTYYYPVLPGFKGCPDPGVAGCDYGISISASEVGCVYCESDATAPCVLGTSTFIQRILFADLDRGTTGSIDLSECSGYSDFTSLSINVHEDHYYALDVEVSQIAGSLDDYDLMYAFIDWGQDYSFYQKGDVYPLTRTGNTYHGDIAVPPGAQGPGEGPSGTTRMRLRVGSVQDSRMGACGLRSQGETEDYVLTVNGCCVGRTGDANNSGDDVPTLGDISVLIDVLFIAGTCEGKIACYTEADVNQSGGLDADCEDITLADISYLIEYLFIMIPCDWPPCPDQFDLPECL